MRGDAIAILGDKVAVERYTKQAIECLKSRPLTVGDLAQELNLSKGQTFFVLNDLEKKQQISYRDKKWHLR